MYVHMYNTYTNCIIILLIQVFKSTHGFLVFFGITAFFPFFKISDYNVNTKLKLFKLIN